jgi:hypothetical protein
VTSRMSAVVDSNTKGNAQLEATTSQLATVTANSEAMVAEAELTAEVAELSERVACGLRKIEALRLNRCSSDRPEVTTLRKA